MRRAVLAAALLLFAMVACSPVYETGYRLEPPPAPASARTESCLAACAAARDGCLATAQTRFQACDQRASQELDLCSARASVDFQICIGQYRNTGVTCDRRICRRRICSPVEIDACRADYRGCFAACGGKVVEEQHCVRNCPD